jgi:hypothetical protein
VFVGPVFSSFLFFSVSRIVCVVQGMCVSWCLRVQVMHVYVCVICGCFWFCCIWLSLCASRVFASMFRCHPDILCIAACAFVFL